MRTHHAASNGGCRAIDHSLPDVEVNAWSARVIIGTSVASLSTSVRVIGSQQLIAHILSTNLVHSHPEVVGDITHAVGIVSSIDRAEGLCK